jgi:hypothetical protein
MSSDTQVNVYNFKTLMELPSAEYGTLRFDPNNTCNLKCVYCQRSSTTSSQNWLLVL